MMRNYRLDDDGHPVLCDDIIQWAQWCVDESKAGRDWRRVALDLIGPVKVSTVFLGLDHGFDPSGPPVLWEPMVFGGHHDGEQDRYTSRADALAGHAAWVKRVNEDVL